MRIDGSNGIGAGQAGSIGQNDNTQTDAYTKDLQRQIALDHPVFLQPYHRLSCPAVAALFVLQSDAVLIVVAILRSLFEFPFSSLFYLP